MADLPLPSVRKTAQLTEAYNLQYWKLLNKKTSCKVKTTTKQLHFSRQNKRNRLNNRRRPVPPTRRRLSQSPVPAPQLLLATPSPFAPACASCHSNQLFAYVPLRE